MLLISVFVIEKDEQMRIRSLLLCSHCQLFVQILKNKCFALIICYNSSRICLYAVRSRKKTEQVHPSGMFFFRHEKQFYICREMTKRHICNDQFQKFKPICLFSHNADRIYIFQITYDRRILKFFIKTRRLLRKKT